ncbi:MAG TPA: ATP-grasp domain-containing protein, partial [Longimicrobiaceae bacterium]
RDKSWQRRVLSEAGLPAPAFRVATSAAEAVDAAREIGAPVVVKPVAGSGSVGVRACADAAEAGAHAAALLAEAEAAGEAARVLVEALVDGPEYSVEVFSGRVVGITRKHLGAPPAFVEAGHDYPAAAPAGVAQALEDTVVRATALLGLGWGPLHWELRMRGAEAVAIEVNPRLAGGFIPELVRHAQGIDLIRETLRLVTGQTPELEPVRGRHASIRFLFSPGEGPLAVVEGLDGARGLPGVVDATLYRAPGDVLAVRGDFRDRIGHVIACADGFGEACEAAERARDAVRVVVGEPAGAAQGGG